MKKVIQETEAAKTRIFPQKGKEFHHNGDVTSRTDDNYLVIRGHVDESMQAKIVRGST